MFLQRSSHATVRRGRAWRASLARQSDCRAKRRVDCRISVQVCAVGVHASAQTHACGLQHRLTRVNRACSQGYVCDSPAS
eukprot:6172713-Pleurochrysis_carterae.AAC.2